MGSLGKRMEGVVDTKERKRFIFPLYPLLSQRQNFIDDDDDDDVISTGKFSKNWVLRNSSPTIPGPLA